MDLKNQGQQRKMKSRSDCVLIPMFLIIGVWGSRERKIRASYFFFLYTLIGSVLMLLGVFYIYYVSGTTDYETLLSISLTLTEQKFLWLMFFDWKLSNSYQKWKVIDLRIVDR